MPREGSRRCSGQLASRPGSHDPPGQLEALCPADAARLDARSATRGEALLAFGPHAPEFAGPTINLSRAAICRGRGEFLCRAATLDARREAIAVMPIPVDGLGEAINDGLSAPPPRIPVSAKP